MAMTRRGVLGSTLALWAPWPSALAGALGSRTRFLFVHASGGWDATRVFALPESDSVDIEADARLVTAGDLSWVSHGRRPSVDGFFDAFGDRTAIVNGVVVRSIAHGICREVLMTGKSDGLSADWPAMLASLDSGDIALPHLVLSGPSYAGDLGIYVAHDGRNEQLDTLVGTDVKFLDQPTRAVFLPTLESQALVDQWVMERAAARMAAATGLKAQRYGELLDSQQRAVLLKDLAGEMSFDSGSDLLSQGEVALDVLARGVSRCVTLQHPPTGAGFIWDSHTNNDDDQTELYEDLFGTLRVLMDRMDGMSTDTGEPLSEVTVVVVLSEMGRTPHLNASQGKDHWPYTSAMIVGAGVRSGVVGGYDDGLVAEEHDGALITPDAMGATLFALAGEDPAGFVDAEPIGDVLA